MVLIFFKNSTTCFNRPVPFVFSFSGSSSSSYSQILNDGFLADVLIVQPQFPVSSQEYVDDAVSGNWDKNK